MEDSGRSRSEGPNRCHGSTEPNPVATENNREDKKNRVSERPMLRDNSTFRQVLNEPSRSESDQPITIITGEQATTMIQQLFEQNRILMEQLQLMREESESRSRAESRMSRSVHRNDSQNSNLVSTGQGHQVISNDQLERSLRDLKHNDRAQSSVQKKPEDLSERQRLADALNWTSESSQQVSPKQVKPDQGHSENPVECMTEDPNKDLPENSEKYLGKDPAKDLPKPQTNLDTAEQAKPSQPKVLAETQMGLLTTEEPKPRVHVLARDRTDLHLGPLVRDKSKPEITKKQLMKMIEEDKRVLTCFSLVTLSSQLKEKKATEQLIDLKPESHLEIEHHPTASLNLDKKIPPNPLFEKKAAEHLIRSEFQNRIKNQDRVPSGQADRNLIPEKKATESFIGVEPESQLPAKHQSTPSLNLDKINSTSKLIEKKPTEHLIHPEPESRELHEKPTVARSNKEKKATEHVITPEAKNMKENKSGTIDEPVHLSKRPESRSGEEKTKTRKDDSHKPKLKRDRFEAQFERQKERSKSGYALIDTLKKEMEYEDLLRSGTQEEKSKMRIEDICEPKQINEPVKDQSKAQLGAHAKPLLTEKNEKKPSSQEQIEDSEDQVEACLLGQHDEQPKACLQGQPDVQTEAEPEAQPEIQAKVQPKAHPEPLQAKPSKLQSRQQTPHPKSSSIFDGHKKKGAMYLCQDPTRPGGLKLKFIPEKSPVNEPTKLSENPKGPCELIEPVNRPRIRLKAKRRVSGAETSCQEKPIYRAEPIDQVQPINQVESISQAEPISQVEPVYQSKPINQTEPMCEAQSTYQADYILQEPSAESENTSHDDSEPEAECHFELDSMSTTYQSLWDDLENLVQTVQYAKDHLLNQPLDPVQAPMHVRSQPRLEKIKIPVKIRIPTKQAILATRKDFMQNQDQLTPNELNYLLKDLILAGFERCKKLLKMIFGIKNWSTPEPAQKEPEDITILMIFRSYTASKEFLELSIIGAYDVRRFKEVEKENEWLQKLLLEQRRYIRHLKDTIFKETGQIVEEIDPYNSMATICKDFPKIYFSNINSASLSPSLAPSSLYNIPRQIVDYNLTRVPVFTKQIKSEYIRQRGLLGKALKMNPKSRYLRIELLKNRIHSKCSSDFQNGFEKWNKEKDGQKLMLEGVQHRIAMLVMELEELKKYNGKLDEYFLVKNLEAKGKDVDLRWKRDGEYVTFLKNVEDKSVNVDEETSDEESDCEEDASYPKNNGPRPRRQALEGVVAEEATTSKAWEEDVDQEDVVGDDEAAFNARKQWWEVCVFGAYPNRGAVKRNTNSNRTQGVVLEEDANELENRDGVILDEEEDIEANKATSGAPEAVHGEKVGRPEESRTANYEVEKRAVRDKEAIDIIKKT